MRMPQRRAHASRRVTGGHRVARRSVAHPQRTAERTARTPRAHREACDPRRGRRPMRMPRRRAHASRRVTGGGTALPAGASRTPSAPPSAPPAHPEHTARHAIRVEAGARCACLGGARMPRGESRGAPRCPPERRAPPAHGAHPQRRARSPRTHPERTPRHAIRVEAGARCACLNGARMPRGRARRARRDTAGHGGARRVAAGTAGRGRPRQGTASRPAERAR